MYHRSHRRNLLATAIASALMLNAAPALAIPGDLDTTFSSDGIVYGAISDVIGEIRGIKPLADGSTLAAGTSYTYWDVDRYRAGISLVLAKYLADGSLDTTFASNGAYVLRDGFSPYAYDLTVTASGQIIVVGKRGSPEQLTLFRFNADGTPDTTFDSDGRVELNIGTVHNARVVVQPNGAIVVAALLGINAEVLRFNADGTLDSSFDSDGRRLLDFGNVTNLAQSSIGLALQGDGKILVGATDQGGYLDFAVWRLNSNGSPDTTFDNALINKDGKANFDLGYSDILHDIAVQDDGKIVLAGQTTTAAGQPILGLVFRINSNGGWASDFNGGSYVTTDFANTYGDIFSRVVVQGNGKIVALGHGQVSTTYPNTQNLIAARYNTDGSLDTTFSGDGMVETAIGTNTCHAVFAGAIDSNGKIYLGGEATNGSANQGICDGSYTFAMVRYEGDGPALGDTLPPTVDAVTPTSGSVAVNATLSATFSELLDAATVTSGNVTLSCDATPVSGTVGYDAASLTVTFTPGAAMSYGAACTATLSTGITDVAGNGLASNYSWSFNIITAYNVDTTAPTVLAVGPTSGATDVAVNSNLAATFSESLDAATVGNSSVTLLCGTTTIPLSVNYVSLANSLAIIPTTAMPEGASCTATLKNTITDTSGNALASDYSWSFVTTGAAGIPTSSGGGGAVDPSWLLLGLPLLWRRKRLAE